MIRRPPRSTRTDTLLPYTTLFRSTPLLLQVVLIYTGLAQLGFVLEAVPAGITALSLCYGAYMAEIFRAGIVGVAPGQSEAARALGLHSDLIFRTIVFPRSAERRVGTEGASTCRSRWSTYH